MPGTESTEILKTNKTGVLHSRFSKFNDEDGQGNSLQEDRLVSIQLNETFPACAASTLYLYYGYIDFLLIQIIMRLNKAYQIP